MSVQTLLDQHEQASRTNFFNDGRGFQKEIEFTCGGYNSRRVAYLRKVDPPTRVVGTGFKRKVIHMENPFLDYVGVWSARGGRALMIEAKSTSNHRLPFNKDGGFTMSQWSSMRTWRHAGAACALVWQFNGKVVLFTPEMLMGQEAAAVKSLTHESGLPVPPGPGSVVWDFLGTLETALWPVNKC